MESRDTYRQVVRPLGSRAGEEEGAPDDRQDTVVGRPERRESFDHSVSPRDSRTEEEEGAPDDRHDTVIRRQRRNWVYLKIWTRTTITVLTVALGLFRAGGGALIVWEEVRNRGGLCSFQVVREVDVFDSKCAESDVSVKTPA